MNINSLSKPQLVAICKAVNGKAGDYARTSINEYRRIVRGICRNPDDRVRAVQVARQHSTDPRDILMREMAEVLTRFADAAESPTRVTLARALDAFINNQHWNKHVLFGLKSDGLSALSQSGMETVNLIPVVETARELVKRADTLSS